MLLTHKPLSNIVEAHITRATGGSKEQFIGEALFGSRFQRLSFLPIHEIGMGPQKGTVMVAMFTGFNEPNETFPTVRHVRVGEGYDTVVDWGGIGRLADYLKQLHLPSRVFLITDSNLYDLYATRIAQNLWAAGFEPAVYSVPAGETSKSQQQVNAIYDWLI